MALNFSYDPTFGKTQLSAIHIGNRCIFEEYPDKILNGVGDCWDFNFETKNSREKCEKVSDDIVDLLPSDPFGMDVSATLTAITGWIEELEKDFGLSALGFVTEAMRFYPEVHDMKIECHDHTKDGGEGGAPHEALFFALGHLGVKDLLSVEQVCKPMRNAVRNDPLLWRNIHIDRQLNDKINDDTLLYLTSRAQGSLGCLSLVECLKITDGGLKRVLENNPRLTKLGVPGCVRLSVEGIVCSLKVFKSAGAPGIKSLRIGGLTGVKNEHFEELKLLLDINNSNEPGARKPRFYGGGQLYLPIDNDHAIDIEECPRCQQFRLVYDCPARTCQGATCRACTLCVTRCINCGCCINGCDFEETFSLDRLCMGCCEE